MTGKIDKVSKEDLTNNASKQAKMKEELEAANLLVDKDFEDLKGDIVESVKNLEPQKWIQLVYANYRTADGKLKPRSQMEHDAGWTMVAATGIDLLGGSFQETMGDITGEYTPGLKQAIFDFQVDENKKRVEKYGAKKIASTPSLLLGEDGWCGPDTMQAMIDRLESMLVGAVHDKGREVEQVNTQKSEDATFSEWIENNEAIKNYKRESSIAESIPGVKGFGRNPGELLYKIFDMGLLSGDNKINTALEAYFSIPSLRSDQSLYAYALVRAMGASIDGSYEKTMNTVIQKAYENGVLGGVYTQLSIYYGNGTAVLAKIVDEVRKNPGREGHIARNFITYVAKQNFDAHQDIKAYLLANKESNVTSGLATDQGFDFFLKRYSITYDAQKNKWIEVPIPEESEEESRGTKIKNGKEKEEKSEDFSLASMLTDPEKVLGAYKSNKHIPRITRGKTERVSKERGIGKGLYKVFDYSISNEALRASILQDFFKNEDAQDPTLYAYAIYTAMDGPGTWDKIVYNTLYTAQENYQLEDLYKTMHAYKNMPVITTIMSELYSPPNTVTYNRARQILHWFAADPYTKGKVRGYLLHGGAKHNTMISSLSDDKEFMENIGLAYTKRLGRHEPSKLEASKLPGREMKSQENVVDGKSSNEVFAAFVDDASYIARYKRKLGQQFQDIMLRTTKGDSAVAAKLKGFLELSDVIDDPVFYAYAVRQALANRGVRIESLNVVIDKAEKQGMLTPMYKVLSSSEESKFVITYIMGKLNQHEEHYDDARNILEGFTHEAYTKNKVKLYLQHAGKGHADMLAPLGEKTEEAKNFQNKLDLEFNQRDSTWTPKRKVTIVSRASKKEERIGPTGSQLEAVLQDPKGMESLTEEVISAGLGFYTDIHGKNIAQALRLRFDRQRNEDDLHTFMDKFYTKLGQEAHNPVFYAYVLYKSMDGFDSREKLVDQTLEQAKNKQKLKELFAVFGEIAPSRGGKKMNLLQRLIAETGGGRLYRGEQKDLAKYMQWFVNAGMRQEVKEALLGVTVEDFGATVGLKNWSSLLERIGVKWNGYYGWVEK